MTQRARIALSVLLSIGVLGGVAVAAPKPVAPKAVQEVITI
jgi:hypothetical protein